MFLQISPNQNLPENQTTTPTKDYKTDYVCSTKIERHRQLSTKIGNHRVCS